MILFESFGPKQDTSRIFCAQTRIWSIVLGKIRNIQIFWVTIRRFLNVFDQNQILFKCSAWNFSFSQTFRSKLKIFLILDQNQLHFECFKQNFELNYISTKIFGKIIEILIKIFAKYLILAQKIWKILIFNAKHSICIVFVDKTFKTHLIIAQTIQKP